MASHGPTEPTPLRLLLPRGLLVSPPSVRSSLLRASRTRFPLAFVGGFPAPSPQPRHVAGSSRARAAPHLIGREHLRSRQGIDETMREVAEQRPAPRQCIGPSRVRNVGHRRYLA